MRPIVFEIAYLHILSTAFQDRADIIWGEG
jgi:hypothetical protein